MQKLTIILAIFLFSCKKEKTCTCTSETMGEKVTISVTQDDMTKEACESGSSVVEYEGITVETSCKYE